MNGRPRRHKTLAILALVALFLGLMALAIGHFDRENRRGLAAQTQLRAQDAALRQATCLSCALDGQFKVLEAYARLFSLPADQFQRVLDAASVDSAFVSLAFTGPDQLDKAAAPRCFLEAMQGRRFAQAFSECVMLAVPVRSGEEVAGVMTASYKPEALGALLMAEQAPNAAFLEACLLIDEQGAVIAQAGQMAAHGQAGGPELTEGDHARLLQAPSGQTHLASDHGACFVTVYEAGVDGWRLVSVRAREEMLAGYRFITVNAAWLAAAMLAILGALFVAYRFVMRAERREVELLRERADCDAMTGFFNKRATEALICAAIEGGNGIHSLFMLDLDGLKGINDTYGHSAGDDALLRVAQAIRSSVRESDAVGRVGGDEFMIFLNNIGGIGRAQEVAERIIEKLGEANGEDALNFPLTCSIGIAMTSGTDTFEKLYREADKALYRAKNEGKNRFIFYS
ncbi:MAG: GGDEF domain-containing protein [Clostridia bacterium]